MLHWTIISNIKCPFMHCQIVKYFFLSFFFRKSCCNLQIYGYNASRDIVWINEKLKIYILEDLVAGFEINPLVYALCTL